MQSAETGFCSAKGLPRVDLGSLVILQSVCSRETLGPLRRPPSDVVVVYTNNSTHSLWRRLQNRHVARPRSIAGLLFSEGGSWASFTLRRTWRGRVWPVRGVNPPPRRRRLLSSVPPSPRLSDSPRPRLRHDHLYLGNEKEQDAVRQEIGPTRRVVPVTSLFPFTDSRDRYPDRNVAASKSTRTAPFCRADQAGSVSSLGFG